MLAGISTSLFFYLERTSKPNIATLGLNAEGELINIIRENDLKICPQLEVIRIDGSFYFGAVEAISDFFTDLYEKGEKKHVLVISNGINFIDLAGAEWLTHEVKKWQDRGGGIYFTGLKVISQDVLKKGGFVELIGQENFFRDKKTSNS